MSDASGADASGVDARGADAGGFAAGEGGLAAFGADTLVLRMELPAAPRRSMPPLRRRAGA